MILNRNLKSKELGTAQKDLSNAMKSIDEAAESHKEKRKKAKEDLKKLADTIDGVRTAIEKNPDNYVAATDAAKKAAGIADLAETEAGKE